MPQKQTSKHIPHAVLPSGGINNKGQMKVVKPDGTTVFVDMKQPRVMGDQGVPVKP